MKGNWTNALMRCLPPEMAHRLAIKGLRHGLVRGASVHSAADLSINIAGLNFSNPLGLAAGFDKNAEAIAGGLGLGFGFVEVGTLTPLPQYGNAKPRVFRLSEDEAVINRYGFNNQGMIQAATNLSLFRQKDKDSIVGVNIGANKDSKDRINDYCLTAEYLAKHASYITVNVSSPNTPGLRELQDPMFLHHVLEAADAGMQAAESPRPLILKIAPDLDEKAMTNAIDAALAHECSGMIISNTTIARPSSLQSLAQHESGGLSGKPLFMQSSRMLFQARQYLDSLGASSRLPLIAAGGIDGVEAAYCKILLGASLLQLYTGLIFKGSHLPQIISSGLQRKLAQEGLSNITEAIGNANSFDEALLRSDVG